MKCSQNNKQINNRKQYSKGVESATDGMVIMLLYVLADKYGFGYKKMTQVMKSVEYTADSINKGYISMNDLKDTLFNEYGITVNFKRDKK